MSFQVPLGFLVASLISVGAFIYITEGPVDMLKFVMAVSIIGTVITFVIAAFTMED